MEFSLLVKKENKEIKESKEKLARGLKVVIMRQDDVMENTQEVESEFES